MITTSQLARELSISQRAIQNRILRLGLHVARVGRTFTLTRVQADAVRSYGKRNNERQSIGGSQ